MRTARPFPLFALVLLLPAAAFGQIIIQHTGATDPVAAGFSIITPGDPVVGPVFDDQGKDAWSILDDRIFDATVYRYELLPEEAAAVAEAPGVRITATLRFVEPDSAAGLVFRTGRESFVFGMRLVDNGDIVLTRSQVPIYTLENGGTDYHEFTFEYDAVEDMLTLWIDGSVRVTGIAGPSTSLPAQIRFGNASPQSHTHWHEVTYAIIPEPAAAALLAGAAAMLAVGILRRRRRMFYR